MILDLHNAFGTPATLSATRLLIRDDYGQPLMVVLTQQNRTIVYSAGGDKRAFAQVLRDLGVAQTAVVREPDFDPGEVQIG